MSLRAVKEQQNNVVNFARVWLLRKARNSFRYFEAKGDKTFEMGWHYVGDADSELRTALYKAGHKSDYMHPEALFNWLLLARHLCANNYSNLPNKVAGDKSSTGDNRTVKNIRLIHSWRDLMPSRYEILQQDMPEGFDPNILVDDPEPDEQTSTGHPLPTGVGARSGPTAVGSASLPLAVSYIPREVIDRWSDFREIKLAFINGKTSRKGYIRDANNKSHTRRSYDENQLLITEAEAAEKK